MLLKIHGMSRVDISKNLNTIGTLSDRTAHDYVIQIINGEEFVAFENERGHYKRITVYDEYSEFEQDVKEHLLENISKKTPLDSLLTHARSVFSSYEPGIDHENISKIVSFKGIKALADKLGFFWGNNKSRPYVNGNEREDVAKSRNSFINYFTDFRLLYHNYTTVKDDYRKRFTV